MKLNRNITPKKKLKAIELKYYQHQKWEPKVGDYYVIVRADAKLFRIEREEGGEFFFSCNEYEDEGHFPVQGFTTEGFGPNRVWVPEWIFELEETP